ncbi:protein kinase domain-containing protein [Kribbella sandramycini]|uniref:non-specific serine/threonine protein kinase n=1 Tax=Kribbella sandramycini TaxID=60450 RepID=A0A841S778_9ACTN|nr:serine/threonine protein kinase [Kribbella sandramycini]
MRRRLGSGGFATVWLAHDEQLDAEVAIKVLADNWGHDDSVRRRFLEEGRFLRRVESEHVVQVHDVGELEDGRPFLVLTYADRGTLADRLKKEPLPLPVAVDVVVQVGRGLQALHRRGLLHRDVKPANVLFRSTDDDGERAVLSDLGLGKSLDEVSRITLPGGTPSYVAPEQALGERLDQRADQYSLGAVAYAALTGRSPHQVDGLGAAGRVAAAPPPSSLGFAVPDKIDAAIVRALDPDRENRWPDVQSFTRELVGGLDETTHGFVAPLIFTGPPEEGQPTALSDANQPTLAKPGATTQPAHPEPESVVESALEVQPTTEPAAKEETETTAAARLELPPEPTAEPQAVANLTPTEPASVKKKKRWGRRVLVGVAALVLGAGAGFGGQRAQSYVQDRQLVLNDLGYLDVNVPRGWMQSRAESQWQPPGGIKPQPAVRISEDERWGQGVGSGIFLGYTGVRYDRVQFGTSPSFQCGRIEPASTGTDAKGHPVRDQISTECGGGKGMLLQRVLATGTSNSMLIQILMSSEDRERAVEIANSVEIG